MRKELGNKKKDEVVGDNLAIPLPFKCEEDIVEWRVQGFTNKDEEIVQKNWSVQLYSVLSITFVSVEKLEDNEQEASFSVFSPESKRKKKTPVARKRKKESFESVNLEEVEYEDNDDDISEDSSASKSL